MILWGNAEAQIDRSDIKIPQMKYSGTFIKGDGIKVLKGDDWKGTVKLMINGSPLQEIELRRLFEQGNHLFGRTYWTVTSDETYDEIDFCVLLPQCFREIPNALNLLPNEAYIEYKHDNALDGDLRFIYWNTKAPERFRVGINSSTVNGNGDISYNFTHKNIAYLFLETQALTNDILITRDSIQNDTLLASDEDAITPIIMQIEEDDTDLDFIAFDFIPTKVLEECYCNSTVMNIKHQANGTTYFWEWYLDFTPRRQDMSSSQNGQTCGDCVCVKGSRGVSPTWD